MREFAYLTFDCYGTLIDWKTGITEALERTMGRLPVKGDELMEAYLTAEKTQEGEYKKYRQVLADTARELAASFGVEARPRACDLFADSVPEWPAFRDAAKALSALGKKGYLRYILSNVDTDLLRATISRSGLSVDGYVTAEEVGSYKPAQGHWRRFMEKTGAQKEEVLHVAQSIYHDILPTQQMGIASAWVNRYAEPLLPSAQPAYIVDSLGSLAEILR